MNRIALTRFEHHNVPYIAYCGLDEQRELTEFQLFPMEEESMLDQIHIAKVEKIVPNIHAAFVKISGDKRSYLPLADAKEPIYTQKKAKKQELCVGDELLVQIVREPIKTKESVCSAKLSLHGKYCLVTSHNCSLGVSKKISGTRAKELQQLLSDCTTEYVSLQPEKKALDFGVVLRTSAETVSDDVLKEDISATIHRFQRLIKESACKSACSIVHQNPPGYIQALKKIDLSNVDRIYTDQADLYDEIQTELSNTKLLDYLELYTDPQIRLSTLYHLNGQIDKLLQSKVWLDSGANIIIEQLETMTVIDINSGKNQSKQQDILKAVNIEAAKEIARQLRLRNISGMIIIDFINMKSKEDEQELIDILRKELKKDVVPCQFIDITKLGLVEVTRKRVHRSLKEILR